MAEQHSHLFICIIYNSVCLSAHQVSCLWNKSPYTLSHASIVHCARLQNGLFNSVVIRRGGVQIAIPPIKCTPPPTPKAHILPVRGIPVCLPFDTTSGFAQWTSKVGSPANTSLGTVDTTSPLTWSFQLWTVNKYKCHTWVLIVKSVCFKLAMWPKATRLRFQKVQTLKLGC